ncbi:SpoIID/LytB domain-containing protein [Nocardioides dongxiaopingii]|uniref:SpoIID/LytB domain-containing protein n=1 Tax=Nocardioides sp. S-1144 TaxID=2582905 RepID=UPI00110EA7C4|nr:SpoIID/LytB domain-containing protein [Nocardioides sp. S-1144]QCW50209.1 SpoIID/LytB domain-containing protein [Nocardioides sp. S-1144]
MPSTPLEFPVKLLVALSTLVLAAGLAAGAPAQAGDAAPAERAVPSVRITGNGYGHGHGLSQYGAQGAAGQGLSHRQILGFYYPGLTWGSAGGNVSVLLTADTSADVVVVDRAGLRYRSLGDGRTFRLTRPRAARLWRITPSAGGRTSTLAWRGQRGRWTTVRTTPGEAQFTARGKPITLVTPSGRRAYRGVLRSAGATATTIQRDTVNVVPLDSYLKGVVPREIPASWRAAALRSQAVAARTYAAFDRRDGAARHYQICDTTSCQVYGGFTDEHPATNRAIDATRGQVLLDADALPAFTQFSASNGGYRAAGSQPYLAAGRDPYDTAYRGWTATVSADLARRVAAANPDDPTDIGTFRSLTVLGRDGGGAFGGRVTSIRITGTAGSTVLTGENFRYLAALRSTLFTLS